MAWSSAMKTPITIAPPPSAPPAASAPTTRFRRPVGAPSSILPARVATRSRMPMSPKPLGRLVHRQADAVVADGELERAVARDEPNVDLPALGVPDHVGESPPARCGRPRVETSGGSSVDARRRASGSAPPSAARSGGSATRCPACRPSSSRSCGRSSVTRLRVVACVRLSSAVISSRLPPIDLRILGEALRRQRQRQVQRRQLLAELVVQLARDARRARPRARARGDRSGCAGRASARARGSRASR